MGMMVCGVYCNGVVGERMTTIVRQSGSGGIDRRRSRGFTLVEMVVVVTVIALVAGAAGGVYYRSYRKRLLEKSARQLLLTAQYARIVAVEQQVPCKMHIDDQKGLFYLTVSKVDSNTGLMKETVIENRCSRPTELGDGIRFEATEIQPGRLFRMVESEEQDVIVFGPDGTADAATICIGDDERHVAMVVSAATGKVRIHRGRPDELVSDVVDLDAL